MSDPASFITAALRSTWGTTVALGDEIATGSSVEACAAGAAAGFAVDLVIHPIDTIKTRSMSSAGFWASGGFHNCYRGFTVTLLCSVPTSSIFFVTYEASKRVLGLRGHDAEQPLGRAKTAAIFASAGVIGETAASIIRLPSDLVRQRMMVGHATGPLLSLHDIRKFPGALGITLFREAPFAAIQYTLYEELKAFAAAGGYSWSLWSPAAGSMSGIAAAVCTTPFDVIRTQWLLLHSTKDAPHVNFVHHVVTVVRSGGVRGLFRGVGPRVAFIGVGGAVYLPVYDWARRHTAWLR